MTGDEKETGRIEAFSDGVFAIAITLLILELKVPHIEPGEHMSRELLNSLANLWHSYVAFFLSFVSILVMWVNHHRIFTIVRKTDDAFLYWNGLLLLTVTVVPFPTGLLAEYMNSPAAKTAAGVYAGWALVIALAFTALWRHAICDRRLLIPGYREAEVEALTRQYRYGPVAYIVALALAFVSAWASIGLCLLLVVFFAFRGLTGAES